MKYCEIVRDLLPLYAEHMTSPESNTFIVDHLAQCDTCQAIFTEMQKTLPQEEPIPLQKVKKSLRYRKIITIITSVILTMCLCIVALWLRPATVDYGNSALYVQADLTEAVAILRETFNQMQGCHLYEIRYAGDAQCRESLAYCNTLGDGDMFTECVVFETQFRSPLFGGGAWRANRNYSWTWYLARSGNGNWQLLTYGAP